MIKDVKKRKTKSVENYRHLNDNNWAAIRKVITTAQRIRSWERKQVISDRTFREKE